MMWLLFGYFSAGEYRGRGHDCGPSEIRCTVALPFSHSYLHVAGLFVLLNAEFLFAVQIIVYAGAILVLYLFVLMLLNLKTEEQHLHRKYALSCNCIGGHLL